jgi:hypothetical protein
MTVRTVWTERLRLLTGAGAVGALLSPSLGVLAGQPRQCPAGHGLCYGEPVNAGPLINTRNFDGGPSLSHDGLTLYLGPRVNTPYFEVFRAFQQTAEPCTGIRLGRTASATSISGWPDALPSGPHSNQQ